MIQFTVLGRPEPQGSVKAFMVGGKPRLTSDNRKMAPWRQQVGWAALAARKGQEMAPRGVPMTLDVSFILQKPKSALKRDQWPSKKPDLDKLVRAIMDSLTGILWEDDSQVIGIFAQKAFGAPARALITVKGMDL